MAPGLTVETLFPADPDVILSVCDLEVRFRGKEGKILAVNKVSFELRRGETLGIVGESGSGKTVTALAIPGLINDPPGRIAGGRILFRDNDGAIVNLLDMSANRKREIRGNKISMVFQEPMTSLNPVYTCGNQIVETFRAHQKISKAEAKIMAIDLLTEVQFSDPESIYKAYPHEISGGQKQRVMIAMAMACNPSILIADEPTTALDVTVQANILRLIERIQNRHNMAVIFITHDLGVIAEVADRILVMHQGKIVEQGTIFEIFSNPQHPYTRGLIACRPRIEINLKRLPTISDFYQQISSTEKSRTKYNSIGEALLLNAELKADTISKRFKTIQGGPILQVRNLKVLYPVKKGLLGQPNTWIHAVDGVSFDVYPGETIGLVGESGCGKTTLGRALVRLIDPTNGEIDFDNEPVHKMKGSTLRRHRTRMQIIFQDPYSSLNPRMTIGAAIMEPMKIHGILNSRGDRRRHALDLLQKVGLPDTYFTRYPHEFSGGERQRVSIARALAVNPKFIICDESVSALDVSVQAQVLNLLNALKDEFELTYIFISHDLSVIKHMADRILVMNHGKLVEIGFRDAIFERPKEEYTRKLINAIPRGDLEDIRKAQLRRRLSAAEKSLFPNNKV